MSDRLDPRRLVRGVAALVVFILAVAAVVAAEPWMALVPPALGRSLTEGFLRGLVVGYATLVLLLPSGIVVLGWLIVRDRRRGRRSHPLRARLLLLCGSSLIGLVGIELASSAWLAWSHRMPRLPSRFPEPSSASATATDHDSLSIVVLGGSSALGYPYDPWLSVGQIVARQLEQVFPERRIALDLRAELGVNLEQVHQKLSGLRRRPNAILVYAGHNEFLSRFHGSRDAGLDEAPLDPVLNRLYRVSLASPLCRLIYETINKHRLGGPLPPMNRHQLIDPPLCTPSEYRTILDDFSRRLEAIVNYCEQVGAVPILLIPPANEGGFEPNRSVLPSSVSKRERDSLTEAFQTARQAERDDDPALALALYEALRDRQPEFTEVHFRLGRLLECAGDWDQARDHYRRALDLDGFPIRCPSPFQDAYRAVAARHDVILIDGPSVLRRISPRGILDDILFHDAHHPSLRAHVALANAVLEQLHTHRAFGWPEETEAPTLDPATIAEAFGLDAAVWAAVCTKAGTFYRDCAPARFDPTERLAKMRGYTWAAARIREGVPAEQAGIPGVGLDLDPSLDFDPNWWTRFAEPAASDRDDAPAPAVGR